jgi:serine/threonine protein kinase
MGPAPFNWELSRYFAELKLFEREAQVLQKLFDHNYISQYRDYFPVSDRYFGDFDLNA